VSDHGADAVERRPRIAQLWRQHRARWTLPLVIILIIAVVAIVDHLDSHRISRVDDQTTSALVPATGGAVTVAFDRPWDGFNPNTPAGAASTTPTLLSAVLPSAYVMTPKLAPQINNALLSGVEVTSTSPLTIEYDINPSAVWSDGVPVSAADFIYAWQSQRGDGVDVDGQADQVASTLGYRDVASVTSSHGGKTVTVVFSTPFTDWRVLFNNMVPAHIAEQVGWNHGFDTFNPKVEVSAGPLIIRSASSGRVVLVRNPRWWGPRSVLSQVTVTDAPSQSAWTEALAANNQTVAQPSAFNLNTLDAVTSLPNTQSSVKPSLNLMELDFNMRAPLTGQAAARQAIAHALDRPLLLNETFGSIDPGLVVNQDHLSIPSQPDYTASSASGEFTTRKLTDTDALLRSIGYRKDAAGHYIDDSGKQLTIRMAVETGDPWIDQVGEEIVAQLNQVGIAVVTVPVDGSAGMEAAAVGAGSYDMALVTRTASPYETTTGAWYSDDLDPNDSTDTQNWSHLDDPEVNQLFVQAEQELNPVAGGTIYAQIDDQLWDQMVALPLFEEPALVANGVQVDNVAYNPSVDGILWNVYLWTLLKPGTANQ
jgi:peptide/nickel transport system substrate-binding protein